MIEAQRQICKSPQATKRVMPGDLAKARVTSGETKAMSWCDASRSYVLNGRVISLDAGTIERLSITLIGSRDEAKHC